jgi:hypothetical protein
MAVKSYKVAFCVITACTLLDGYQRFEGTSYVPLQGRSLVVFIQWFIYMTSSKIASI